MRCFRTFFLTAVMVAGVTAGSGLSSARAAGQPLDYYLPAGVSYDPKVPTPEQFFGFQLGEWHLRSELLNAYLRAVAAAAPERVVFEVIGQTHEAKPVVVLTITSPENQRNLEKLRLNHLALLDPAKAAAMDVASMPVVVNLGYSIHGNEPSGVNAVPAVVYHLAAARGSEIDALLASSIILVEPLRNPDGSDRFAQWANGNRSQTLSADPASREHLEAWPRSRTNHYWFDPNRDWLPLVHPEAKARAELFHRWRPNVLTDHHEMGTNNTFFFQPGVPSRNNPLTPKEVFDLTAKIAAFHTRALDAKGLFYYSEQGFDDFYPGKGSTYPDLHGSVGILFEQASSRGHVQESENGLLTFAFTIRNQVLTSLSTLAAAQALRSELLALQKAFTPSSLALARQSRVKAYVFSDGGDPARGAAFIELLRRHRIEVRPVTSDLKVEDRVFPAGSSWIVPVEQPQYRLVTEVFGRRTEFVDSVFYDVSAWSLPLAYNVPHAELEAVPGAGAALVAAPAVAGKRVGGRSGYAYLFHWHGYYAPRALHRLQKAGVRTKVLTSPIQAVVADGTSVTFDYGSVLVPVGMQAGRAAIIEAVIDEMVREDGVTVYAASTGLTPSGVDLGSASFVPLPTLAVALVTGEGVDAYDAGEAWHALDTRVGTAVTLIDLPVLARAELARYTAIVMVDGTYDAISDATVESLRRWIRSGGTLVTMAKASEWAAKKELIKVEFDKALVDGMHQPSSTKASAPAKTSSAVAPADSSKSAVRPDSARRLPYAKGDDLEALKLVAGAIFETTIDVTHPLGYGFLPDAGGTEATLPVFRTSMLRMKPSKSPYETPMIYTEKPLLAGYISEQNLRVLGRTAAAVAQPLGQGVVVAMTDNPNFRGYWLGGNKVFFNALLFGKAIRPVRAVLGDEAEDEDAHE